jgi:hypothetical protein
VALATDADQKVIPTQTATLAVQPCIGVCVEKLSTTWCLVQHSGRTPDIFTGLSRGTLYAPGDNGALATYGSPKVLCATDATHALITL